MTLPGPSRLSLRPAVAIAGDFQVGMAVRLGLERGLPGSGTGPGTLPGQGGRGRYPA